MIAVYNNISAIKALGAKIASSAGNIANVETDRYKKTDVTLVEGKSPGSIRVEITRDDSSGPYLSSVG